MSGLLQHVSGLLEHDAHLKQNAPQKMDTDPYRQMQGSEEEPRSRFCLAAVTRHKFFKSQKIGTLGVGMCARVLTLKPLSLYVLGRLL
jgi:hypothetical protein